MRAILIAIGLLTANLVEAAVLLGKTRFVFATTDQARQVLTNRDDFVKRLSPFDRSARLKTDQPVPEAEFLKFVAANVVLFTSGETNRLTEVLSALRPKVEQFNLPLPDEILIIKTTGHEEGQGAYTRSNAIVLPTRELSAERGKLENLLLHELFHVISRHNAQLKEALYESIGYHPCHELALPASMMRLTNPDAPINDHYIRLKHSGKDINAIPILLASAPHYDTQKRGEFFNYLKFKLLAVEIGVGSGKPPEVSFDPNSPTLLDVPEVEGFFEQIGRNTGYVIHPEETLADNFVLLLTGATNVKSPEILERIRKVIAARTQ